MERSPDRGGRRGFGRRPAKVPGGGGASCPPIDALAGILERSCAASRERPQSEAAYLKASGDPSSTSPCPRRAPWRLSEVKLSLPKPPNPFPKRASANAPDWIRTSDLRFRSLTSHESRPTTTCQGRAFSVVERASARGALAFVGAQRGKRNRPATLRPPSLGPLSLERRWFRSPSTCNHDCSPGIGESGPRGPDGGGASATVAESFLRGPSALTDVYL